MNDLKNLYDIIFGDYKVVVITGAGISTLSGIPDFRGKNGLYSKGENAEYMLSHSCFIEEPDKFYEFYKENLICEGFEPNIVHEVLAKLEERGFVDTIITQNIDGLHTKAGSKNVLEIHGNGNKFYCTSCGMEHSVLEYKESSSCKVCGSIVRPDIVLYEEPLNRELYNKAIEAMTSCDKVIVLGSSLSVGTVTYLLNVFINNKMGFTTRDIFIVNQNKTMYDGYAHTSDEDLGEVFKKVLSYDN